MQILSAIKAVHRELAASPQSDIWDMARELGACLLTEEEALVMKEMLDLLEPAVAFTHWAGSAVKPTLSHIYRRAYELLPSIDSVQTVLGRTLHGSLQALINEYWPLGSIPEAMLLAIFFNPACVTDAFLDRVVGVSTQTEMIVEGDGAAPVGRRSLREVAKAAAIRVNGNKKTGKG